MRFYVKRLKQFDKLRPILENYETNEAMQRVYTQFDKIVAKMMMREAVKASSFRMYVLPKRKSEPGETRNEVYKTNFKRYFESEKYYMERVKYYTNEYRLAKRISNANEPIKSSAYYTKHGFYPYSRKRPNPPIPPEFVNIQSGELVNSYKYELKMASNYKSIIFKMRNESIHFFFIVDSVGNNEYRMMDRPLLDYLASRLYKVYNEELPRINTLLSPIEYRR